MTTNETRHRVQGTPHDKSLSTSAAPMFSLAICTYNRAHLLEDTLRSLTGLFIPSDLSFEVLIIDNNSSDATRIIAAQWSARTDISLRYIFEGEQGVSIARNRAATEAHGSWIWFVDDDVYFDDNWLCGVAEGIRAFPDAAAIAGRVLPVFEGPRPAWLPDLALDYYGMTRFGEEQRWLKPAEYPIGANVAFRRDIFNQIGLFRTDLGHVGNSLRTWEETEFSMRLYRSGRRIAYMPGAVIMHRVPRARVNRTWLIQRVFCDGISQIIAERSGCPVHRTQLVNQARMIIRRVLRDSVRLGISFLHQLYYARELGMAYQNIVEAIWPSANHIIWPSANHMTIADQQPGKRTP